MLVTLSGVGGRRENTYVLVLGRNPGFPLTFFGKVGFFAFMMSSRLNSIDSMLAENRKITKLICYTNAHAHTETRFDSCVAVFVRLSCFSKRS